MKEKISLSIEQEILKKIKKLAGLENRNLSQYTEDLYRFKYNEIKSITEDPIIYLDNLQKQINELRKLNTRSPSNSSGTIMPTKKPKASRGKLLMVE